MSNYVIKTNDNELYHYGVLGMKWGVHKGGRAYVSTNRKLGGNYDHRKKERMRKQAIKILEKDAKQSKKIADNYSKGSSKKYQKSKKIKEYGGDPERYQKYRRKAKAYSKLASKAYSKHSYTKRTISDLETYKLKAGKDYVTNRKLSTNIPLDILGIPNVSSKLSLTLKNDKKNF